jgi:hypothetical protein
MVNALNCVGCRKTRFHVGFWGKPKYDRGARSMIKRIARLAARGKHAMSIPGCIVSFSIPEEDDQFTQN